MRVAVAGGTGLVGNRTISFFTTAPGDRARRALGATTLDQWLHA